MESLEYLKQQNAALAAQVVELRDALRDQLNDCINFDGGKLTDVIMKRSSDVLAATPQHHLRQMRADAVTDFIEFMYKSKDCQLCSESLDKANQYANQIRQEVE